MKTDWITLRTLLFPQQGVCDRKELYVRTQSGAVSFLSGGGLSIDGSAAFDTCFNVLPAVKYREYCCLSSLFLKLRMSGSFVVQVFGVTPQDGRFVETCVFEQSVSCSRDKELSVDLTAFWEEYDHLYLTLTSRGGILYGGGFVGSSQQVQPVKLAVVICTFKREEYLLHNHRSICQYLEHNPVLCPENLHFYIVDNGKTLDPQAIENDYMTLLPNENTGGSGGFTRGYYEAVRSGQNYTHILLMDDDIILDCEMLLRVYSLLRVRKPEWNTLSVGGSMIRASDRVTLHEAGAVWDGKRLHSIGNGANLTVREAVFEMAYYPKGNYHAWWFFCFPAGWQQEHGYPLQFFIKEDDIEYSLRCADEIAVLSGIAVWHDDFDAKYDGFQEYYIKRNELIMTSVSSGKPYALFQVRKLILSVMKQTVYQRYFLADIIFRAYDDYLRGWEHFYRTDTVLLNRELMESCAPLLTDEQLREQFHVSFRQDKYELSRTEPEHLKKQALTLNGYLIPYKFYHQDQEGYSMADLAGCRIVNFYRHRRVLHYDLSRRRGFVTVQKKSKLFGNLFRLLGKSVKFLVLYPSVRRGYRQHLKELTTFPPSYQSTNTQEQSDPDT